MNEMWEALEKYQPYAEKHGFGAEWLKMTTERTEDAAWAADAVADAGYPARAARLAANAVALVADAIKHINKAIEIEEID